MFNRLHLVIIRTRNREASGLRVHKLKLVLPAVTEEPSTYTTAVDVGGHFVTTQTVATKLTRYGSTIQHHLERYSMKKNASSAGHVSRKSLHTSNGRHQLTSWSFILPRLTFESWRLPKQCPSSNKLLMSHQRLRRVMMTFTLWTRRSRENSSSTNIVLSG